MDFFIKKAQPKRLRLKETHLVCIASTVGLILLIVFFFSAFFFFFSLFFGLLSPMLNISLLL